MNSKAVLIRALVILGIVGLVFLAGCGGSTGRSFNDQSGSNPTPTIATISPNSAVAGGAAFTLTINGTNFVVASMVNFGGMAPATTFVSSTQLTAAIPAGAIVTARTAAVTVTNPAPGGGTSNAMNFTITSTSGPNPVPTIISLSPSCAPAGGPGFYLWVYGSNFVRSSVVRWNGSDRPTTVFDASDAQAQIPASDVVATGTPAVTVFNPAPGGFAYVDNTGCIDGNVSMYTINPTTGALTSIGPPVDSNDEGAHSVTVDPFGKFAYVANWGEGDTAGSVSAYTINAAGGLTSIGTIAAGLSPTSIAIHPSGKFAYVANSGSNSVSMYSIDATTGALTLIGTVGT